MVGDLVGYVKGTLLGTKNIDKKLYISLYLGQEPSLVCTYIRTRRVIFSVIFFSYIFMMCCHPRRSILMTNRDLIRTVIFFEIRFYSLNPISRHDS